MLLDRCSREDILYGDTVSMYTSFFAKNYDPQDDYHKTYKANVVLDAVFLLVGTSLIDSVAYRENGKRIHMTFSNLQTSDGFINKFCQIRPRCLLTEKMF